MSDFLSCHASAVLVLDFGFRDAGVCVVLSATLGCAVIAVVAKATC